MENLEKLAKSMVTAAKALKSKKFIQELSKEITNMLTSTADASSIEVIEKTLKFQDVGLTSRNGSLEDYNKSGGKIEIDGTAVLDVLYDGRKEKEFFNFSYVVNGTKIMAIRIEDD